MKYLIMYTILISTNLLALTNDPKTYIQSLDNNNQWFAYTVPTQSNTQSMCCWNKSYNIENIDYQSCDLSKNVYGFGSLMKSPLTENVNIYIQVDDNRIRQILPIGDSCKVKISTIDLTWLSGVNQDDSINWFNSLINNQPEDLNDNILRVLSLHQLNTASKSLFNIAKNNKKLSEKAIFWLGESRNDGVKYLKQLYKLLPIGQAKKQINFALAQSKDKQGLAFLKHIAKTDENYDQKADAIFWLAQENAKGIVEIITDIINNSTSKHLVDHSIFSLAQIETKESAAALLELAQNHAQQSVREKALFWLAEVNPIQAKQIAMQIITDVDNKSEIDNAIFTLTQLSEDYGDEGLFELLTGNYNKHIKKKALFWLSQSDDSQTIDKLQKML